MSPFIPDASWPAVPTPRTQTRTHPSPIPLPFLPPISMYPSDNHLPRREARPSLSIHALLQYTNHVSTGMPCCPIEYDLREVPYQAFLHPAAHGPFSPRLMRGPKRLGQNELNQPATVPPVTHLSIVCGLFQFPWRIEVSNSRGVTIYDVLQGIHNCMHKRVRGSEWARLSPDQQNRISRTFHERCGKAMDPWAEKEEGVLRVDCLVSYTRFAGISLQEREGATCVLTLARNHDTRD